MVSLVAAALGGVGTPSSPLGTTFGSSSMLRHWPSAALRHPGGLPGFDLAITLWPEHSRGEVRPEMGEAEGRRWSKVFTIELCVYS